MLLPFKVDVDDVDVVTQAPHLNAYRRPSNFEARKVPHGNIARLFLKALLAMQEHGNGILIRNGFHGHLFSKGREGFFDV